jgi:hypothetical protein
MARAGCRREARRIRCRCGAAQGHLQLLDPLHHLLEIVETCAGLIDRLAKRIEDAIGDPPPDE